MGLNSDMTSWYDGNRNLDRVVALGRNQAGGNYIASDDVKWDLDATVYTVSVANSTSGTLGFSVKMNEETDWEDLLDPSTSLQQTIDLANPESFQIYQKNIYDLRVEPDTVVGTYDLYIKQQVV